MDFIWFDAEVGFSLHLALLLQCYPFPFVSYSITSIISKNLNFGKRSGDFSTSFINAMFSQCSDLVYSLVMVFKLPYIKQGTSNLVLMISVWI